MINLFAFVGVVVLVWGVALGVRDVLRFGWRYYYNRPQNVYSFYRDTTGLDSSLETINPSLYYQILRFGENPNISEFTVTKSEDFPDGESSEGYSTAVECFYLRGGSMMYEVFVVFYTAPTVCQVVVLDKLAGWELDVATSKASLSKGLCAVYDYGFDVEGGVVSVCCRAWLEFPTPDEIVGVVSNDVVLRNKKYNMLDRTSELR